MSDAFSTAVSGLQAASRAVAISASNIVNARSGGTITADGYQGYQPQAVTQSSVAGGGVVTGSRPVVPAYMPTPGADGGTAYGLPNSSLSTDLVQMRMAQAAYKASAALIRTENDMQKTTLSVIG
ncbi:flagellar basal body rod protein FlgC [Novispirillum itersonii]|uniref:Flagellar basal body rod protein FlgC n=1 Tax=Novispirillum itersonii TaxID=189 RepID=A0A7W9ZFI9_NOVIT|nr:hypothetical protein [Novispirillum itersonii]MBB6210490.1 flagellar basal body rod protein FlgC [Novispirillum itersonii]